MADKRTWASGDPTAERRSCTCYSISVGQPMTTPVRIYCSTKFPLDLNTRSGNLFEINKTDAPIGHCASAAWKNSACSVGSQRYCVPGLGKFDAHLNGTDSGADSGAGSGADSGGARVNTPAVGLSVPLAAPIQCEPALIKGCLPGTAYTNSCMIGFMVRGLYPISIGALIRGKLTESDIQERGSDITELGLLGFLMCVVLSEISNPITIHHW